MDVYQRLAVFDATSGTLLSEKPSAITGSIEFRHKDGAPIGFVGTKLMRIGDDPAKPREFVGDLERLAGSGAVAFDPAGRCYLWDADDGRRQVRVYDDLEEALKEWGPRSLLTEAVVLYDENGVWLEPVESWGPRRLGGLMRGKLQVTLRPNPESDWPDPIGLVLDEASELVANRHFGSLDELRARFPWEADSG